MHRQKRHPLPLWLAGSIRRSCMATVKCEGHSRRCDRAVTGNLLSERSRTAFTEYWANVRGCLRWRGFDRKEYAPDSADMDAAAQNRALEQIRAGEAAA